MSDDLQISDYGKTSIERSQGFEPMPASPREVAAAVEEKAAFDRGVERIEAIDQAGEAQPMEVGYKTEEGKPYPEKYSVSPERSAAELSDWRRGLVETEQALRDQALADEIDRLRGAETLKEPIALDQQAQQPQPISEPPPLPPELQNLQDPESAELVAAFQREPKLLSALNTLSWQHDQKIAAQAQQALQYTQAVEQQYAQYTQANANVALAAMFSNFGELKGMSLEQINAAVPIIERTNPERGAQIRAHVAQVSQLASEARQVQAAQAQQQQQKATAQFQNWAAQQDNAWEAEFSRSESPQRQAAIRQEAAKIFRDAGVDPQQLWNSSPLVRSKMGQDLIADAARWRLQQRTAQSIRPAPVPPVKVATPGAGGMRASEDDHSLRDLNQKLNSSHSARDAAALLSARRAR